MYKLIRGSGGETNSVYRISDDTSIPFDPDNTDYIAYLAWLSEGNQPTPADEVQS
jgi:hypothetical protein